MTDTTASDPSVRRPRRLARVASFTLLTSAALVMAAGPAAARDQLPADEPVRAGCYVKAGVYVDHGGTITTYSIAGKILITTKKKCDNGTWRTVSSSTAVIG